MWSMDVCWKAWLLLWSAASSTSLKDEDSSRPSGLRRSRQLPHGTESISHRSTTPMDPWKTALIVLPNGRRHQHALAQDQAELSFRDWTLRPVYNGLQRAAEAEHPLLTRMARTGSTCTLLLLMTALSLAQSATPDEQTPRSKIVEQRRKQYPDLSRIVDLAQAVPPEFSASFLLRIAASAPLRDRAWKKELLEQAFQSAALAQQPIRRKVIAAEVVAKSRAEVMSIGFDQRLDRLSLQSLATREMLQLDKPKAFEMFQAISFPGLHQLHCEDALVDHVSDYYELLGRIIGSVFTPEELRYGRHVELLNYKIGSMDSPVQLAPMAVVLASAALSPEELKALTGSFGAALERIQNDDRSFSVFLSSTDEELNRCVDVLKARGVMPDALIEAYRRYL